MITFVYGGAGSGKSEFAENIATSYGSSELFYVATMMPVDTENEKKIQKHRKQRENKNFETIECYSKVDKLSFSEGSTVLFECVSNWVANEMFGENSEKENITDIICKGVDRLVEKAENIVFVSNNIFSDNVDYDDMTLEYMEQLGEVNSYLAEISNQTIEVVCGLPFYIKK